MSHRWEISEKKKKIFPVKYISRSCSLNMYLYQLSVSYIVYSNKIAKMLQLPALYIAKTIFAIIYTCWLVIKYKQITNVFTILILYQLLFFIDIILMSTHQIFVQLIVLFSTICIFAVVLSFFFKFAHSIAKQ